MSGKVSDGSHLENISIQVEGSESGQQQDNVNTSGLLTREQFYTAFESLFGFSSAISGLKSLEISKDEKQSALATSNAIYDMALESPWLRWLIQPESIWAQRVIVIGTFGFMKFQVVKLEIQSRKQEQEKPKND
jgi:hypothetical protein